MLRIHKATTIDRHTHTNSTATNRTQNLNKILLSVSPRTTQSTKQGGSSPSLVTGDAAVNGGLPARVDDEEGKSDGRVLGGVIQGGDTVTIPPHQVLEGKDLVR